MSEPRSRWVRRMFDGRTSRWMVAVTGVAGFLATGLAAPATASRVHGASDPAVVRTAAGAVRGTVAGGHREFDGIPYAAPPGR